MYKRDRIVGLLNVIGFKYLTDILVIQVIIQVGFMTNMIACNLVMKKILGLEIYLSHVFLLFAILV